MILTAPPTTDIVMPFGKYRGLSLIEITKADASYLQWICDVHEEGAAFDFVENHKREIMDALIAAAPLAPDLKLTPHQFDAVTALDRAILDGESVVRLEGGAGYGKSYATAGLVRCLHEHGIYARGMAVSYVASQVLNAQLAPYGVPCRTVASTLRYRKTLDLMTGRDVYEPGPETFPRASRFLSSGNALIVDECSMIDDGTVDLLAEAATNNGGVLIFVGDSHQLPPVHQETRSLSCSDELAGGHVATLTKPMRYSEDSHLFAVERTMREDPWSFEHRGLIADRKSDEVIMTADVRKMLELYVANYRMDPHALHRALFYRRKTVNDANNLIRSRLYGENAPFVVEDERLMILATTDHPYITPEMKRAGIDTGRRFYSGQNFSVKSAEQAFYRIDIDGREFVIPHWKVRFTGENESVRIVFSITETRTDKSKLGGVEFEEAVSAAYAHGRRRDLEGDDFKQRWKYVRRLDRDFVRVAYQYATTVHRAQGQTVDYAYVQPRPLLAVEGITGRALAYVAMTRAREQLVLS